MSKNFRSIYLGIAINILTGLLVTSAVANAQTKDLGDINREIEDLQSQADTISVNGSIEDYRHGAFSDEFQQTKVDLENLAKLRPPKRRSTN